MANELLDFKKRDDFEFLYFSSFGKKVRGEKGLAKLKSDCQKVLDRASKTVLDLCLLGRDLQNLKISSEWKSVWNEEEGRSFEYDTFESFCAYAFGFSQTRTSDLLRIAKFVTDDEEPKFINDEYREYNTSQLIELAAVKDYDWKYFNPTMTVSDMRRVKKYMREGDFYWRQNEPNFDVMAETVAWENRKKAEKEKKNTVTPTTNVLPGQISLTEEVFEPEEDELEESENQISDLAQEGEEAEYIEEDFSEMPTHSHTWTNEELKEFRESEDPYDMPMQTHSFDSDDFPEEEERESEEETSSAEEKKNGYDFSTRTGVRAFLHDYENWDPHIGFIGDIFKALYVYRFKNGMYITAATCAAIVGNGEELTSEIKAKYYIKEDFLKKGKEITQNQFEVFAAKHYNEL